MVRCVRNNLFHGGKHTNNVPETEERTTQLLRRSLAILRECLNLAPNQRQALKRPYYDLPVYGGLS
jgi:hypothetical protein